MNIHSFYDLNDYELINDYDENKRDIRLYKFEQVELTGFSNHYPDILLKSNKNDYFILPTKEMTMSLNKKSYYEENGMKYDNYNKIECNKTIDEHVYYFIYNNENYYHFIYDTLPYLHCYFILKERGLKIKLLTNFVKDKDKLLPFVEETLDILGIKNDIIIHNSNTIYSSIYVSSSLTHNGLSNSPPRNEIFEIYDRMIKNVRNSVNNYKHYDNIYISRRTWLYGSNLDNIGTNYTTRRKLINEDELVLTLEKYNFTEFFGENLNMTEKIVIFNNAKQIIGAIGGTITNCVFCNKDCKIITLVSPDFLNINNRIKYLLQNNNILFTDTYVDCNPGEIAKNIRVEIIDTKSEYYKLLGEIDKYMGKNDYLIKLANNLIGWNNETKYNEVVLNEKQFKTLDNGLNSPWYVQINQLIKYV